MKILRIILLLIVFCMFSLTACQSAPLEQETSIPDEPETIDADQPEPRPTEIGAEAIEIVTEVSSGSIPPGALPPDSLIYLGAFRLPDDSGGLGWDYSGQGMTFFPGGDSDGEDDGFPGSLFIVGHDHQLQVAEISIPQPVNSRDLAELNFAATLQPFADLTAGLISMESMEIPVMGIEYLESLNGGGEAQLHFAIGQHFQEFEPSHGSAALDLSNPNPAGLWIFNGYSNYISNDYLFAIPEEWADANGVPFVLASGRFREGVWGGLGPALFAYTPLADGGIPAQGSTLTDIQPLLLYGAQVEGAPDLQTDDTMRMDGYGEADHWWGGAWLTSPAGNAVIFTGTKAMGNSWYGFANGVVWAYDCAENPDVDCPEVPDFPYDNRGYWAEDFIPAVLFFDPEDLGKVVRGEIAPYEPQPYGLMDLSVYWYAPETDPGIYKRDLAGAVAFDQENGLLYIIERLADEYKSVVHVFQITGP
jgi:hypothetical protein